MRRICLPAGGWIHAALEIRLTLRSLSAAFWTIPGARTFSTLFTGADHAGGRSSPAPICRAVPFPFHRCTWDTATAPHWAEFSGARYSLPPYQFSHYKGLGMTISARAYAHSTRTAHCFAPAHRHFMDGLTARRLCNSHERIRTTGKVSFPAPAARIPALTASWFAARQLPRCAIRTRATHRLAHTRFTRALDSPRGSRARAARTPVLAIEIRCATFDTAPGPPHPQVHTYTTTYIRFAFASCRYLRTPPALTSYSTSRAFCRPGLSGFRTYRATVRIWDYAALPRYRAIPGWVTHFYAYAAHWIAPT